MPALVHKLLGTAYDSQGRFQEALAEFQIAAQSGPDLPDQVRCRTALFEIAQRR
jgi:hypothetical protein